MADTQETLTAMYDTVDSLCGRFASMGLDHPNEYGLNNNCVYVSIAHLLGKSLKDYLTDTEQMQPNNAADTPGITEVAQMLNETGKQIFTYSVTNPADFKFRTYAAHSPITTWGVLFRRTDGSGHCIVLEHGVFRDYQPDPVQVIDGGAADDVENQIVYVFSISEHDVTEAPTGGDGGDENQGGDGADGGAAPAAEPPQDEDEEMADGTTS